MTAAIDGGKWLASCSGRINATEKALGLVTTLEDIKSKENKRRKNVVNRDKTTEIRMIRKEIKNK
jgi:hypothetical protein